MFINICKILSLLFVGVVGLQIFRIQRTDTHTHSLARTQPSIVHLHYVYTDLTFVTLTPLTNTQPAATTTTTSITTNGGDGGGVGGDNNKNNNTIKA